MRTRAVPFGVEKTAEPDPNGPIRHSDASVVHEADSVADRALAGQPDTAARHLSAPGLRAPILQRVQRDYGNRASQQLVMRALQQQASSSDSPSTELDLIPSGGGQPLETSARAPLEQHFQADLGDVRVHTGPEAVESATSLDALAYTSGRDIYFAPGMYAPMSSSGRRLLAHEVAHVVQQSSGKEPAIATKSSRGVKIGAPEDILETEADRSAEEFMGGGSRPDLTEEERKKRESSGTAQGVSPVHAVQRQQPQPQSTTSLDATALSIIRAAGDTTTTPNPAVRAEGAVWGIIRAYYSSKAMNVNSVTYDNAKAGTGLATEPYPVSNPTAGRIYVGDVFLNGVQSNFARRVLQVGHELEHIDQFRDPKLGPGAAKKDEREFLAFYHEALATEVPHTGTLGYSTRVALIDGALGYYNCLASAPEEDEKNAAKKYAANQQELLTRRSAEIATGKVRQTNPPPADCRRQ